MASQPSSAAKRHIATASAKLLGPSSTPGRMWQWRSIMTGLITAGRAAGGRAGLPGLPRLTFLRAIGFVVFVALAEARLVGAVAVEHRAEDLDAGQAQTVAAEPRLLAGDPAAAQGPHHAVRQPPDDGGVGHRQGGGGVEDDEGEARPPPVSPRAPGRLGARLARGLR